MTDPSRLTPSANRNWYSYVQDSSTEQITEKLLSASGKKYFLQGMMEYASSLPSDTSLNLTEKVFRVLRDDMATSSEFRTFIVTMFKAGTFKEMPEAIGKILKRSCMQGDDSLFHALLDAGLDYRQPASTPAFNLACLHGRTEIVRRILEEDAGSWRSPLQWASHFWASSPLINLRTAGENPSQTHSPLALACLSGKLQTVQVLLAHGAKKEMDNPAEIPRLMTLACMANDPAVLNFLLESSEVDEIRLLHLAKISTTENRLAPLKCLTEHGLELARLPLLCIATNSRSLECMRWLIDQGQDLEQAHEYSGLTPLSLAVRSKNTEAIHMLAEAGASARATIHGRSLCEIALDYATDEGDPSVLDALNEGVKSHCTPALKNLFSEGFHDQLPKKGLDEKQHGLPFYLTPSPQALHYELHFLEDGKECTLEIFGLNPDEIQSQVYKTLFERCLQPRLRNQNIALYTADGRPSQEHFYSPGDATGSKEVNISQILVYPSHSGRLYLWYRDPETALTQSVDVKNFLTQDVTGLVKETQLKCIDTHTRCLIAGQEAYPTKLLEEGAPCPKLDLGDFRIQYSSATGAWIMWAQEPKTGEPFQIYSPPGLKLEALKEGEKRVQRLAHSFEALKTAKLVSRWAHPPNQAFDADLDIYSAADYASFSAEVLMPRSANSFQVQKVRSKSVEDISELLLFIEQVIDSTALATFVPPSSTLPSEFLAEHPETIFVTILLPEAKRLLYYHDACLGIARSKELEPLELQSVNEQVRALKKELQEAERTAFEEVCATFGDAYFLAPEYRELVSDSDLGALAQLCAVPGSGPKLFFAPETKSWAVIAHCPQRPQKHFIIRYSAGMQITGVKAAIMEALRSQEFWQCTKQPALTDEGVEFLRRLGDKKEIEGELLNAAPGSLVIAPSEGIEFLHGAWIEPEFKGLSLCQSSGIDPVQYIHLARSYQNLQRTSLLKKSSLSELAPSSLEELKDPDPALPLSTLMQWLDEAFQKNIVQPQDLTMDFEPVTAGELREALGKYIGIVSQEMHDVALASSSKDWERCRCQVLHIMDKIKDKPPAERLGYIIRLAQAGGETCGPGKINVTQQIYAMLVGRQITGSMKQHWLETNDALKMELVRTIIADHPYEQSHHLFNHIIRAAQEGGFVFPPLQAGSVDDSVVADFGPDVLSSAAVCKLMTQGFKGQVLQRQLQGINQAISEKALTLGSLRDSLQDALQMALEQGWLLDGIDLNLVDESKMETELSEVKSKIEQVRNLISETESLMNAKVDKGLVEQIMLATETLASAAHELSNFDARTEFFIKHNMDVSARAEMRKEFQSVHEQARKDVEKLQHDHPIEGSHVEASNKLALLRKTADNLQSEFSGVRERNLRTALERSDWLTHPPEEHLEEQRVTPDGVAVLARLFETLGPA